MEHVIRSCLISVRLGQRMGLTDVERAELYYLSLMAWVGCMADSSETSAWFGDDLAFRADVARADTTGWPMLWFLLRRAGSGAPPWRRARMATALVLPGGPDLARSMAANCQVTGQHAERLGLGERLKRSLAQVFARRDGRGMPAGLKGEDIARTVRLMQLADLGARQGSSRLPTPSMLVIDATVDLAKPGYGARHGGAR
jgi:hypothetical protein